jgi:hypothetical protein
MGIFNPLIPAKAGTQVFYTEGCEPRVAAGFDTKHTKHTKQSKGQR